MGDGTFRALLLGGMVGALLGVLAGVAARGWYESSAQLAVISIEDPTRAGFFPIDGASAALPILTAILQTGPAADEVIESLSLGRVYRTNSVAESRTAFWNRVSVTSDRRSSIVGIAVRDRDPKRARDIALALSEFGMRRMMQIWAAGPRSHREKLESRLAEISDALAKAEQEMQSFRERTGIVDLEEQRRAAVTQAAALEKLRIEKNLGARFAERFSASNSPEVSRARTESLSASQELASLGRSGRRGLLPSLSALPLLEVEHARLKRAIDENVAARDILFRQIQQLHGTEARPLARIDLIDVPIESRVPSRPSRLVLLLVGAIGGAGLAGLLEHALARRRERRLAQVPAAEEA